MYSEDKAIMTFDDDTIKVFSKLLNRELKKRYKWFEKIEIDKLTYSSNHLGPASIYIGISGDIFIDEDWVGNQWSKYNYSRLLTKDELSFGDIIGKEESKEIQDIIFLIFSAITGHTPKYSSFSWINVIPVDRKLQETIRKVLIETLESKWNKGLYNYQHGYCHYFAYNIIGKIKKRFPKKKVNYYMILANEVDKYDGTVVQDYLIHVYIQIDDMLLDSNGLTTKDNARRRAEEWEERQSHLIPEEYETIMWEEESDTIPEYFFNNKFCNTGRVKKDIEDFLSNPIIQRILRDK